jgi:hypothetical protein
MKLKLLITESVFHVLAVAIVIHALLNGGSVREAAVNAGIISILGRVTPTELLDKILSIPLGKTTDEKPDS